MPRPVVFQERYPERARTHSSTNVAFRSVPGSGSTYPFSIQVYPRNSWARRIWRLLTAKPLTY